MAEALDVAIIGAGTAGLSARAEIAKLTDSYRVFDPGPYGTLCARTACMPSKAFLQSAHDFHRRHAFDDLGIVGAEYLRVDGARVLEQTRRLRDGLVEGVLENMESWRGTHLVSHRAAFDPDGTLRAGDLSFRPRATVIATGSHPIVPADLRDRLGDRLITSDEVFELQRLPARIAVLGLGPVGLELGQAMARLGVDVTGFDPVASIGGLTDPELQTRLRRALRAEMTIVEAQAEAGEGNGGGVVLKWPDGEVEVDCVLAAMGRAPSLAGLGLEELGVMLDGDGRPELPDGRLDLPGTRLYFAGDAGAGPELLHEASDEGRVAGYFAARCEDAVFDRRVPLRMVFCAPQIALAGATWDDLGDRKDEVAIGEASFDRAGRMKLQRKSGGGVRIYAEKATGRLLGAAILAPEAEHLAHLMVHAIDRGDDLMKMMRMPAYHPTHEEVLRRALRAALANCDVETADLDSIRCEDPPVGCDT